MGGAKEERVVVVIYTDIGTWLHYAYTCLFAGVAARVMRRGHAWLETAISFSSVDTLFPSGMFIYIYYVSNDKTYPPYISGR
jgi:hypothetical protein